MAMATENNIRFDRYDMFKVLLSAEYMPKTHFIDVEQSKLEALMT
jgi:hypothetical protein